MVAPDRPAVSGVILSYGYVWINGRNGYGASFPFNKGTADGQPFQWMYHKAAYNIFLIVLSFRLMPCPFMMARL